MPKEPITASDIAAWPLDRGRGYTAASVEELQSAAAAALLAAETRIADLTDSLGLVQAEAHSKNTTLDLPAVVARLGPAQLRQAGVEAVGRAIVGAEEQAAQITARARTEASRLSAELARMAAAVLQALDAGHNPTHDVNQLRMLATRILAATAPLSSVPTSRTPSRPD